MVELDRIDPKILRTLADDGRLSWCDLVQKVGLSLTPMLYRVRRLEEEHYIQGYSARLDGKRLSGTMSVFVPVSLEKQTGDYLARFRERAVNVPQVMGCFQITGDADYMLRAVVKDLTTYQAFLTNTLTCIPGVVDIKSTFAPRSAMLRSAPPL